MNVLTDIGYQPARAIFLFAFICGVTVSALGVVLVHLFTNNK